MPVPARSISSRQIVKPALLVFVLFYLGFHAISGDRGLYAWFKESKRLEALNVELAEVRAERMALERKVKLLSSASLDLDMLDEQAREVLGLVGADEVVVLVKENASR